MYMLIIKVSISIKLYLSSTCYFEEIERTRARHILKTNIGTFRLQTDPSGWPVLTNGKHP